ncbi:MAG: hypothetical protein RIS56_1516 [Verrucomicrobiota bacterium]|jgi:hypothetical protein
MEQQNLAIDFYKTLGEPPQTRDRLLRQGTGSLIGENEALVGGSELYREGDQPLGNIPAVQPPSTGSATPVMKAAASEARNRAALAIS